MSNIQYRLLGGEQVIPLLGDEQTTRSRVVMISKSLSICLFCFVAGQEIVKKKK